MSNIPNLLSHLASKSKTGNDGLTSEPLGPGLHWGLRVLFPLGTGGQDNFSSCNWDYMAIEMNF